MKLDIYIQRMFFLREEKLREGKNVAEQLRLREGTCLCEGDFIARVCDVRLTAQFQLRSRNYEIGITQ